MTYKIHNQERGVKMQNPASLVSHRYNWDAGKSVTFARITVTDQSMGWFHREGLAKESECCGSFKRHFSWKKGAPVPAQQLYPAGGR
jgi:hypothetical protein